MLPVELRRHRFDDVRIGATPYGPMDIDVGDFRIAGVDMLLGEDFLRKHRIFVAYQAGKLFIAR